MGFGWFSDISWASVVCTSGVSAGHTIPHSVLCSCLGFASLPSLPIGELTRRRWDSVEANVRRFNTYKLKKGKADDLETFWPRWITELIKSEDAGLMLSRPTGDNFSFPIQTLHHVSQCCANQVEAAVLTCDTPARAWWAFFTSPQFPVASEYFRPSEMILVLMASSRLKSFPLSMNFWA